MTWQSPYSSQILGNNEAAVFGGIGNHSLWNEN